MIEVRDLTKRYGDFTAVGGISLTAAEGAIFGFLGPNGAGKTTTIRIISGLSLPTSGTVLVNGIDVAAEPVKAKSILGYIPDRPYLYENNGKKPLILTFGQDGERGGMGVEQDHHQYDGHLR